MFGNSVATFDRLGLFNAQKLTEQDFVLVVDLTLSLFLPCIYESRSLLRLRHRPFLAGDEAIALVIDVLDRGEPIWVGKERLSYASGGGIRLELGFPQILSVTFFWRHLQFTRLIAVNELEILEGLPVRRGLLGARHPLGGGLEGLTVDVLVPIALLAELSLALAVICNVFCE